MQTNHSIFAFLSGLLLLLGESTVATGDDAGEPAPLWEISIQSNVEWPPIPAPTPRKTRKEKSARGDAKEPTEPKEVQPPPAIMITERTLQASLAGQLLAISDGNVRFAPVLGGDSPVSLPLDSILSLRKVKTISTESDDNKSANKKSETKPPAEKDAGERLVTFRSGSCVPGRLKRISAQGLVLAFGGSEELTVPLEEILSITPLQSDGKMSDALPPADGRHVARLTTGEIVTGNIAPVSGDRDRLTISSPILSGEFPLALIESMLFPTETNAPESSETEIEAQGRLAIVSFPGGASLTSPSVSLVENMLELEIWEGAPFRIPLNSAETITFVDKTGIRPNGPVFIWGQFTDKGDEFTKLQAALEGAALARETIVMDGDEGIGDHFSAALQRSTAFVWGEWENIEEAALDAALSGDHGQPIDDQLQTYVRNGGIAIFIGMTGGTAPHFGRLGLGEIKSERSIGDGSDLELIGIGEALAPVTDGEIKASNSTMMYTTPEGSEWTPLLTQPGKPENAAIIGQKIGSGWVFVMGMDFYETNENITRILIELMQFRR